MSAPGPVPGSNPWGLTYQAKQFDSWVAGGQTPSSARTIFDTLANPPAAGVAAENAIKPPPYVFPEEDDGDGDTGDTGSGDTGSGDTGGGDTGGGDTGGGTPGEGEGGGTEGSGAEPASAPITPAGAQVTPAKGSVEPEEKADLGAWTVAELKGALDDLEVDYPSSAKKADLVELLEEAQNGHT